MPKERLLGKNHQRNQIYLHSTKPKILMGYSTAVSKKWQTVKLADKSVAVGGPYPLDI